MTGLPDTELKAFMLMSEFFDLTNGLSKPEQLKVAEALLEDVIEEVTMLKKEIADAEVPEVPGPDVALPEQPPA